MKKIEEPVRNQLKVILIIGSNLIEAIPHHYIGTAKAQKKYSQHMADRLIAVRTQLLALNEFKEFVTKSGDQAVIDIINEFDTYNKNV